MRTIGLLGGMSWESSDLYYQHLNRRTAERLGGLHSCEIVMRSVDFAAIEECQEAGDWKRAGTILVDAARALERGGAQALVICTNTMHKLAEPIQDAIGIPLIHIADATAADIRRRGVSHPLLLGTRYTMEQDFYKGRLAAHGIEATVPDELDRGLVHDVIYGELCRGVTRPQSKAAYLDIVRRCRAKGVDSVILGCTEIGMLVKPSDLDLPVLDTTLIHAEAALEFALGEQVMPMFSPHEKQLTAGSTR